MLNNNIVFKFFFYQFNATREYQFIIYWMRIFQYTFISLCYSLENKPLADNFLSTHQFYAIYKDKICRNLILSQMTLLVTIVKQQLYSFISIFK